ncbi:collagen-binding surface adhesin Spad (antigen I/II family) [Candidatus Blochmanniella floridana]|uniref:Collagen-binding surface adhesin Spad (Antigen I/II family) n=1 Tax=Blochmanniella floridana TaxID=203907 RepID=Q7VR27_BLOFL|nr:collagen-binding surface adhesin Spad (antigen I/II family) [Candidatus Blochmannia floridanus]
MYFTIKKRIIYLFFYLIFFNCIIIRYDLVVAASINLNESSEINCTVDFCNWRIILSNMLQKVVFFDDFIYDEVVLINIFQNNTNGILPIIKITNILISLIEERFHKYTVISLDKLYQIYRELEVSVEDHEHAYEFAMKIANYLQADYIIYGVVEGDFKIPHIKLQLILSSTGEILCVVDDFIQTCHRF